MFCAILSIAGMAQNTRTVKGMVMTTDEEPLSGATIRVLGSNSSVESSHDGRFEIEAPMVIAYSCLLQVTMMARMSIMMAIRANIGALLLIRILNTLTIFVMPVATTTRSITAVM